MPVVLSEQEKMYAEIDALWKERDTATARVQRLKASLQSANLSTESLNGNDAKCWMLTGIAWLVFQQLFFVFEGVLL